MDTSFEDMHNRKRDNSVVVKPEYYYPPMISETETPEPVVPFTEKMLMMDERFAASARDVYLLMEGQPFEGNNEAAVKYGIDVMTEFNFNLAGPAGIPGESGVSSPGMVFQTATLLSSGSEDQAKSFIYLMDQYDRLPMFTLNGTTRAVRAMLGDASIYGTIGAGIAANRLVVETGKGGIRQAVKALASRPALVGGLYTGAESVATEKSVIEAEKMAGQDVSPEEEALRLGVTGTIGTALGAGFVGVGEVAAREAAPAVAGALREAGEAAQGRIDERAADTGVTLTSGVDPSDAIDQAIAGAGRLVGDGDDDIVPAPPEARGHKTPAPLLIQGDGEKPVTAVPQAFPKADKTKPLASIDLALENNPGAVTSVAGWKKFTQETMGGDYLPHPPMVAIEYASSAEKIAEKLSALTPELKAGVDEGFGFVQDIRGLYESGGADPAMTADLFVWGILSRGAGPVQQEAAFIDIMEDAVPMMQKVVDGTFSEADMESWVNNMKLSLPEGSPGKQVTMNVNAAGKLLFELSKMPEGSNRTVLEIIHDMIADPNVSAKEIRRQFMTLTESAGIDNKVVSFILLVAGRDDVLVMDRIQGRHLWDDGRFGGENIYDGIGKGEGLNGIFKGPRGLLVTEAMEDALRPNIQRAYDIVGRPEDASLGRFHWESWVIEGEQVVSHSTLRAISKRSPVGEGVTEGKTDEFASGFRYIRGEAGPVQRYPLSDGSFVYMTPERAKEFLAHVKNAKNGIVPRNFKVTARADIPWYERAEVDRAKLDQAARDFQNSTPEGKVLPSSEGAK